MMQKSSLFLFSVYSLHLKWFVYLDNLFFGNPLVDAMPLSVDTMPLLVNAMPLLIDAMPLLVNAMSLSVDTMPLQVKRLVYIP
ncbi:MAG: hypothetical protein V7L20_29670 [Nostoc sp.]